MKRNLLDVEDGKFMSEARGFCFTADYNDIYPAIDRRINYGDECRVSPMECVTVLDSSKPRLNVNKGGYDVPGPEHELPPHNYHYFPRVQVVE